MKVELRFLFSAYCLMMLYMFHENILNGLIAIEGLVFSFSKGHNSVNKCR